MTPPRLDAINRVIDELRSIKSKKDWLSLAAEPPFRKNFRLADAQGD